MLYPEREEAQAGSRLRQADSSREKTRQGAEYLEMGGWAHVGYSGKVHRYSGRMEDEGRLDEAGQAPPGRRPKRGPRTV